MDRLHVLRFANKALAMKLALSKQTGKMAVRSTRSSRFPDLKSLMAAARSVVTVPILGSTSSHIDQEHDPTWQPWESCEWSNQRVKIHFTLGEVQSSPIKVRQQTEPTRLDLQVYVHVNAS